MNISNVTGLAVSATGASPADAIGAGVKMLQELASQSQNGQMSPTEFRAQMQAITAQVTSAGAPGGNIASQPVPFSTMPSGEISSGQSLTSNISDQWSQQLNNITQIGSQVDSLQQQAEQLMSSPNPADQAQGQMMMEQAQEMFNALSQMMKTMSDMAEKAIQNSSSQ
jgi:hypothetical protein